MVAVWGGERECPRARERDQESEIRKTWRLRVQMWTGEERVRSSLGQDGDARISREDFESVR